MNPTTRMSIRAAAGSVCLAALFSSLTTSVLSQMQTDGSRQIVLDEFARARPSSSNTPNQSPARHRSNASVRRANSAAKLAHYRRVTEALSSALKATRPPSSAIGITLWRLRPTRLEDEQGARLLVMQNDEKSEWTPERVEAETPLKVGDRVRISIEAPRSGYLYVIDREQYSDGTLGDAYLIFPTSRTHGGDNRVRPGKLIDIPAQEDNPNHFTLVPNPGRTDQIGELLTIILSSLPLSKLPITDKPVRIGAAEISDWEKTWGAPFERFEMEGGAGLAWTKEERAAGARETNRYLTTEEPTPQTIYRVATTGRAPLLVDVRLNYRNR